MIAGLGQFNGDVALWPSDREKKQMKWADYLKDFAALNCFR